MVRLNKYDIVLMDLNPTRGAEKRGVRPCVILQNNPKNHSDLQTVTLAPMTTKLRTYSSMEQITPSIANGLDKESCVDLSQIRTVDKNRHKGTLGHLEEKYYKDISEKIANFLDLREEYL